MLRAGGIVPIDGISRRALLYRAGLAAVALRVGVWPDETRLLGQDQTHEQAIESFTGPAPNPHWNSIGSYVSEPQKAPLISESAICEEGSSVLNAGSSFRKILVFPNGSLRCCWLRLHPCGTARCGSKFSSRAPETDLASSAFP